MWVVRHWQRFLRGAVEYPALETAQTRLEQALNTTFCNCTCFDGEVGLRDLWRSLPTYNITLCLPDLAADSQSVIVFPRWSRKERRRGKIC